MNVTKPDPTHMMFFYRQVDASGFPTREGLVRLYAEGVQERGYYLATAEASHQCLQSAHQSRLRLQPSKKTTLQLHCTIV
jgi:hypothetical protein